MALFARHSELERPVPRVHRRGRVRPSAAPASERSDGPPQRRVDLIYPALFSLSLLRELNVWLGDLPDPRSALLGLLSCHPNLEKLEVVADQAEVSLCVVVSPSLREIILSQCHFEDTEPSIHPSLVNRTLTKLVLARCTFPNDASLLLLQQFQGLENLVFSVCCGPVVEQPAPWFHLIRGLPVLRHFHAQWDWIAGHPESRVFPADQVLSGVASALAIRANPWTSISTSTFPAASHHLSTIWCDTAGAPSSWKARDGRWPT